MPVLTPCRKSRAGDRDGLLIASSHGAVTTRHSVAGSGPHLLRGVEIYGVSRGFLSVLIVA